MPTNLGLIRALHAHGLDYKTLIGADQCAQQANQLLLPYLIAHSIADAQCIMQACANFFGLEYFDLYQININEISLDIINIHLIQSYWLLPIKKQQNYLSITLCDPRSFSMIESIEFQTGLKIKLFITNFTQQLKIINHLISIQIYFNISQNNVANFLSTESDKNIIVLVDQIISDAVHQNASDIHFEPYLNNLNIRLRIDGLLHGMLKLPNHYANAIGSRIKILADLDIAERRKPQDGRFQFISSLGLQRDCRISACPTISGEKIVIRILETQSQLLRIDQLGMTQSQQTIFLHALKQTQGLILVTGPTGSGKSITLYAALQHCHQGSNNITTIENPVEIRLNGINQININYAIGMDFASALRTVLRQDPDIIMIGEIRDEETANMAIRAAQTGHLVLATLHTNDTLAAITRLQNLGIANHNIASCLKLVVAQRLIRKCCVYCSNFATSSQETPATIPCSYCHDGYSGRIGIYELLAINSTMRETLILGDMLHLHQQANAANQQSLLVSAQQLVTGGITTSKEIERVLGEVC